MAHHNTVLHQLLHLLPMDAFDAFVGQHNADKHVKRLTCRQQLLILLYAQATGKETLREIETGLRVLDSNLYHLGIRSTARSTIAYANEHRPAAIYESLFYELLEKCHHLSGTARFSFKNDLHALDATTINLCLSLFDWAHFRKQKGAMKLHTDFNLRSQIPECVTITTGKRHEVNEVHHLDFASSAPGTIFVFDRGYTDYDLWWTIRKHKHHFVTRLKSNAHIVRLGQHRPAKGKGVLTDERIAFALPQAEEQYPKELRLVTFYDEETGKTYRFVTDEFRLSAANIAAIYKRRWEIETFFKWIKQHLKIKTFLGTSENAVKTQIWVAMIYFLLMSWLKHQMKFRGSLTDLTRMVGEIVMWRVSMVDVVRLTPKTVGRAKPRDGPCQLSLC